MFRLLHAGDATDILSALGFQALEYILQKSVNLKMAVREKLHGSHVNV